MRHRFAALLCLTLPVFAQNLPMFRGNLQHTGVYDAAGVQRFNKVKWKFHTNGYVFSSPAIVNDTAYVGSTDGNLYAIDLATGTQRWKFTTHGRVNSSPAVANGMVYFMSFDSNLYAVDATTGKLAWKFKTSGERRFIGTHLHGAEPANEAMPDPFDCYLSSPAVSSNTVYFGSGDGNVYAVDASSGNLKWKFHTGDVVHASPAIADGVLYIGSWDSYFYALDAATGAEKWRFKTGEDPDIHNQIGIQSSAAVADGTVYFGCRDSNLYALDARTGQKKWQFNNKGSWVITSPAVISGKVYFATSDSAIFYALDAASGTQLFSLKYTWPIFASPAIARGILYLGGEDGKMNAIDLSSQKPLWEFQTDGSRQNLAAYSKPNGGPNYAAVTKDDFYDSIVIAVNQLLSVGMILSSPVVVDDAIYFGSSDGNLYALM